MEMREDLEKRVRKAGRRAVEYRRMGFHCSESTFLAINETLNITDPSMVRIVTGFHGGGGSHRIAEGVDINSVLEGLASGRDRRSPEEAGIQITGHVCGALASGIVCIGFLYGRLRPQDDLTCVDELSFDLHSRFLEEFGEKECLKLREKYVPLSHNNTCEYIYSRGAEIAVRLILEAPKLIRECKKFRSVSDPERERDRQIKKSELLPPL
jgi:C_GCAxxG_C_C family probable redox protein